MNTADKILAEAHKLNPNLQVDMSFDTTRYWGTQPVVLLSSDLGLGISLRENCIVGTNGEPTFTLFEYSYVQVPQSVSGGFWEAITELFIKDEKTARDLVFAFVHKINEIMKWTNNQHSDKTAAEFDSDVEYFRNWANMKEVVS